MRWIVSDPISEQKLKQVVAPEEVEVSMGDSPFREAIAQREPCLLVLPSRSPKTLLVARINSHAVPDRPQQNRQREQFGYQPSGFLGLSDEVVYEDQPEAPKKKRFW